ncbi:5-formaminoimidazole-4-carboxamide-1-(beta)-D-ribofuranosyl 5'-monophosphate synthetase [Candidatus Curtissbacteria bacterium RIFCSPLOWO2_01_FULL_42_26]|uniref:5-formaminoimidazole-4-carboxamide-1-(Beta)-D-ribofuranosyl 5'-monophosphate synthetase n=1 Tax=Candidatus Curtissbacteria bacterium RIFCSPLOWO2_01_FULL_42_26 TaxID=1797729 RepID=A0A1F5I443_9BACT|nr:MAG: 5-formaminoimidazole-4-carboxamide-1-(beta)-D-ribofuranosyl 5'-monophosphate synthetase [Candidatus Curtissbacteria bacterium RIFCSPLOWO2_01_FULL_42_26]
MLNYQDHTVVTVGSHSALDICRGAKDEGFKTLVIVEKGRDKTYTNYFKSAGALGCVDEVLYVEKFKDILKSPVQKQLIEKNCIFIPHRSFEVYVNDYDAIEKDFKVPVFGNKKLLRFEERDQKPNQYDILHKAGIKYPKIFKSPEEIDRLVIVKVLEKERGFERAFFIINSVDQYNIESERLIKEKKIAKEALKKAVIEEFILGVQVNFNFFFSPLSDRLELLGTDTRRQTNLDGFIRLPGLYQPQVRKNITYEEAGHIAVTILESMLEPAFEIGEKFVKATEQMVKPGVIGPFALQASITPGPPKKEIVVFDVSPRMPGSPGISATPYSNYLYDHPISMGRRVAMEIREAIVKNKLSEVTT